MLSVEALTFTVALRCLLHVLPSVKDEMKSSYVDNADWDVALWVGHCHTDVSTVVGGAAN